MLQQHILLSLLTLNVHLFGASDVRKPIKPMKPIKHIETIIPIAPIKHIIPINFNQAHHSLRHGGYSQVDKLRRDFQHSVYRFGQCDRENLLRKYLRKTLVTKIPTEAEAPQKFLYLLAKKNTINRKLQCVVVRIFTNGLFMFVNSRFPMYYCQGIVHYLMMNSIQRLEVHEFFLSGDFKLPADIKFYFYHPNPDY